MNSKINQSEKIVIDNATDLYKLPISTIKNTKLYNFTGKYYDKIYEEALKIERSGMKLEDACKKPNVQKPKNIILEIFYATEVNNKRYYLFSSGNQLQL
jgi:hypothetical protein